MTPATETTDPRDLERLLALLRRVDALLELPAERLSARGEQSGWSAGEHLFHLTLANDLSLKNARNLLEERGRLRTGLQELDPRAAAVLARGRLPHGTQAPRFVTPPPSPDLDVARSIQADVVAAAAALTARAHELGAAPLGIPHQTLGVLTASSGCGSRARTPPTTS